MNVCQPRPITASVEPTTMNGFGPSVGRNRCDSPAPITIATVTGRKATPALIGLYPSTFCTKSTM